MFVQLTHPLQMTVTEDTGWRPAYFKIYTFSATLQLYLIVCLMAVQLVFLVLALFDIYE